MVLPLDNTLYILNKESNILRNQYTNLIGNNTENNTNYGDKQQYVALI